MNRRMWGWLHDCTLLPQRPSDGESSTRIFRVDGDFDIGLDQRQPTLTLELHGATECVFTRETGLASGLSLEPFGAETEFTVLSVRPSTDDAVIEVMGNIEQRTVCEFGVLRVQYDREVVVLPGIGRMTSVAFVELLERSWPPVNFRDQA